MTDIANIEKLMILMCMANTLKEEFGVEVMTVHEGNLISSLYVEEMSGRTLNDLKNLSPDSDTLTKLDEKVVDVLTTLVINLKNDILGGV